MQSQHWAGEDGQLPQPENWAATTVAACYPFNSQHGPSITLPFAVTLSLTQCKVVPSGARPERFYSFLSDEKCGAHSIGE